MKVCAAGVYRGLTELTRIRLNARCSQRRIAPVSSPPPTGVYQPPPSPASSPHPHPHPQVLLCSSCRRTHCARAQVIRRSPRNRCFSSWVARYVTSRHSPTQSVAPWGVSRLLAKVNTPRAETRRHFPVSGDRDPTHRDPLFPEL